MGFVAGLVRRFLERLLRPLIRAELDRSRELQMTQMRAQHFQMMRLLREEVVEAARSAYDEGRAQGRLEDSLGLAVGQDPGTVPRLPGQKPSPRPRHRRNWLTSVPND